MLRDKKSGVNRVLISANSHNAINNVLKQLKKKNHRLSLIKLSRWDSNYESDVDKFAGWYSSKEELKKIDEEDEQKRNKWVLKRENSLDFIINKSGGLKEDVKEAIEGGKKSDKPSNFVIGATSFASVFFSEKVEELTFDLIVIDEASQLTTMNAALVMSHCHENTRFLIVGDNNQLPAILRGKYPVPDGERNLFGSVFDYFDSVNERLISVRKQGFKVQLNENFRMNDTLCAYFRDKVYGDKYRSYNKEIRNGRISLNKELDDIINEKKHEMYREIINPDYPLVVCFLSGEKIKDREADMVVEITELMRNHLDIVEEEFCDEGYGIIIPHHEHIDRVRRKLGEKDWYDKISDNLVVDTVDKLQGQERDVIVCSYGMEDIETALKEAEFIYSRNRMIVSLSRARKKCILLISEELCKRPVEYLTIGNDAVIEGMDFVSDLKTYMEKNGCKPNGKPGEPVFEGIKLKIYAVSSR